MENMERKDHVIDKDTRIQALHCQDRCMRRAGIGGGLVYGKRLRIYAER